MKPKPLETMAERICLLNAMQTAASCEWRAMFADNNRAIWEKKPSPWTGDDLRAVATKYHIDEASVRHMLIHGEWP